MVKVLFQCTFGVHLFENGLLLFCGIHVLSGKMLWLRI